jgi:hypothetical protein
MDIKLYYLLTSHRAGVLDLDFHRHGFRFLDGCCADLQSREPVTAFGRSRQAGVPA